MKINILCLTVVAIISTMWLTMFVVSANAVPIQNVVPAADNKLKRGNPMPYIPHPPPPPPDCYIYTKNGKPCPKPSLSPEPSFGIPGGSSIDIYVPTSTSCATAFSTITSYNFESGNLVQHRQCRSLVLCLQRWIEQLVQLILAGLTPGATFSNTLSSVVTELNTAFGYINSNLGGILSESGTTVTPIVTGPVACTMDFQPVLAANGQVYANECTARAAGAPNPYVSVTTNGGTNFSDITNQRVALTLLYTKYVIKILGFMQTYLAECVLSTESRIFANGITSLNSAVSLIVSGDYNAAKNLVIEFSRNV